MLLILLLWLSVLLAIAALPVVVSKARGPGYGVLVSLLAFPTWKIVGPSPGPYGGLIDGCICVFGYMLAAGMFMEVLYLWIASFFR